MSLLQYETTQSFTRYGGSTESPDPRPQGESWTLADHWAEVWACDPSEESLQGARTALESWLKRTAPAEGDDSTFEDWVLEDGKGYAVAQVANKFGITEARV